MKRATQIALGLFSVTIGLGLAACGASGENTRPLVIGICVAAIGFIRLMSAATMTDAPSPGAALPDFDDPRWRGSRGPQLAGRPCADCGKKITVALEAAQCELCGEATHEACLAEHRAHAHAPEGGGPFR